jgi:maleate isomerase
MTDSLGYRMKFGVIAPSTNTSVQPEYDAMRPYGVTNHFSRCVIPDTKVTDDKSFMVMLNNIRASVEPAIRSVMSSSPDHIIMGMSAETFWDGLEGQRKLERRIQKICGHRVTMGSDKCDSPMKIAHTSKERLRDAILEVNKGKVDAVVQVGTNLAMAEVAAMAEFWLDKPVLAINTATYWYALRKNGIKDKMPGWGSLFLEH